MDGHTLSFYASSLAAFDPEAIDAACVVLEGEVIQQFTARWPEIGRFQELCRQNTKSASTHWTAQNYRECQDFDQFLTEQMEDTGETRQQVIARYVEVADAEKPMREAVVWAWTAWKNQKQKGSLSCPNWCERCRGDRLIQVEERGKLRWMNCPDCRRGI